MSTIQKQQEDFASELFKKSSKEKNQEEVKRRMSPPEKASGCERQKHGIRRLESGGLEN